MSTTTTDANNGSSSQPIKQGTNIDEALGQTELGSWVSQNKTLVVSTIVGVIVGVIGFGTFFHFQGKKEEGYASALYKVTANELKDFEAGKVKPEVLKAKFEMAWADMGSFEGAAPYLLQVVDGLTEKNNKEEAYALVQAGIKRLTNAQSTYFLSIRGAALAEDLDKKEEAIEHLKRITSSSVKYFEGKVYLDLGRLYLGTGDKEKAKTSFQYVVDNSEEVEFKKMARLYLEELEVMN